MSQESEPLPRSPLLGVSCDPPQQRSEAGAKAIYAITLENRSNEAQTQSIEVRGLPLGWCAIDFDERRACFPGEQRSATLIISVPEGTESGRNEFQIVARASGEQSGVRCALEVEASEPSPTPSSEPAELLPSVPGVSLIPLDAVWTEQLGDQRLTLTVRNVGSSEAQYAITLTGLPAAWYTLPSSQRVPAGEAIAVELRLHPPAGAQVGDHPFKVRVAIEGRPELATEIEGRLSVAISEPSAPQRPTSPRPTQQPHAPQTTGEPVRPPGLALLPGSTFRFGPGEVSSQATLTVQNASNLIEHYEVRVEGIPHEWFTLATPEIRLDPGAIQQVHLRLTPRPGRGFPAGDYPFRVRVAPLRFPDSFSEVGGTIVIIGVPAFDARLVPLQAQGRKEKFKLTLANTGTVPLSPWMEGSDPNGMCKFKIPPPPNLDPGDEAVVPIWVGARRNGLIGQPETLDFRIRVTPAGGESTSAKSFDARFGHQPFLSPRFAFYTLLAGLITTIAGIIFALGPSRVSDGITFLDCQRDSSFVDRSINKPIIKNGCGPRSEAEQKVLLLGGTPIPEATASPTVAESSPTLTSPPAAGDVCGIASNKQVIVATSVLQYRDKPGDEGTVQGKFNENDEAVVTGESKVATVGGVQYTWWPLNYKGQSVWAAEAKSGETNAADCWLKPKQSAEDGP